MIRIASVIFTLLFSLSLYSQNYAPEWGSLDKRPVPGWFEDAKFGIFHSLGLVLGSLVGP